MKHTILTFLSGSLFLLGMSSCQEDEPAAASHELRLAANLCAQPGATRGVQLNTTGSNQSLSNYNTLVTTFTATCYEKKDGETDYGTDSFFDQSTTGNETVETDGNTSWTMENKYTWTSKSSLRCFAYANLPATGATVTQTDNATLTLSYTVPALAANQNDILLGFFEGEDDNEGVATLYFSHPLTAVAFIEDTSTGKGFRVKTTSGTDPVEVSIKSIELQNVYTSGTTTLTPSLYLPTATSKLSDVAGALNYTWTSLGTANLKVSQSGTTKAPWLPVNATTYHNGTTTETLNVIGQPFIIIPQNTTTSKVTLKIKATIMGGGDVELLGTIKDKEWKPGITNIYKLSYTFESLPILVGGSLSVEPYVPENAKDLNLE